jgi:hypothetical protein
MTPSFASLGRFLDHFRAYGMLPNTGRLESGIEGGRLREPNDAGDVKGAKPVQLGNPACNAVKIMPAGFRLRLPGLWVYDAILPLPSFPYL